MNNTFNDKLRQILLLILIILLGWLFVGELYIFLPGLLGGVTLYIVSRTLYYKLVFKRKWKKGGTALLFMLGYLILIAIPVYFSVRLISPKINSLVNNQHEIMEGIKIASAKSL